MQLILVLIRKYRMIKANAIFYYLFCLVVCWFFTHIFVKYMMMTTLWRPPKCPAYLRDLKGRLENVENYQHIADVSTIPSSKRLPLLNRQLHCSFRGFLDPFYDYEFPFRQNCLNALLEILEQRHHGLKDIDFELVLWWAVNLKDGFLLKTVFKTAQENNFIPPKSVLSTLLHRAIRCHFVEGVVTCLQYGADPNNGAFTSVITRNPPLCDALLWAFPLYRFRADFHEFLTKRRLNNRERILVTNNDDEFSSETESTTVRTAIVTALLDKGADLGAPYSNLDSGGILMHQLAEIAAVEPTIAKLLIDRCPVGAYEEPVKEGHNYFSPLAYAFYKMHSQIWPNIDAMKNIFETVLIPLLRSGATMEPDYLDDDIFTLFVDFFDNGTFFWLPWRDLLSIFLMEARQSSKLGSANTALRSLFPRKLQHHCRTVILRHLIKGPKRKLFIQQLPLPKVLISFLLYDEFGHDE